MTRPFLFAMIYINATDGKEWKYYCRRKGMKIFLKEERNENDG